MSPCVQVDAEIWGINRCYLKKLIYGQLNNMPINPDLIGNQGTFFLSAMQFHYSPFSFSSFGRLFRNRFFFLKINPLFSFLVFNDVWGRGV